MTEQRVSIGSLQDAFLYEDDDEYTDDDGNPTGILLRGLRVENIYLNTDPTAAEEAARKGYVDGLVAGSDEFTDLIDTPANYTAANYKLVRVNNTPDALEFATLAGTANQVIVTHAAGSITLSLPQDIDTGASPTFDALTLTGNLLVDGHSIGITADPNLLQLGLGVLGNTGRLEQIGTATFGEVGSAGHIQISAASGAFSIDLNGATGNAILNGDLIVDGGDIGITGDTDLIGLSVNLLTIRGNLTTSGSIISTGGSQTGKFLTGSAGNTVFSFSGDNFDIRAGSGSASSQNVMRVTSAGDFGIGTNSPGSMVHIQNAVTDATGTINASYDFLNVEGDYAHIVLLSDADKYSGYGFSDGTRMVGAVRYYHNGDYMQFRVASAESMRVTAGGAEITGTLEVNQTNATLGTEAMIIKQDDQDKAFTDFQGTTAADFTKNISTQQGDGALVGPKATDVSEGWVYEGMIKVEINGTERWIPYFYPDV